MIRQWLLATVMLVLLYPFVESTETKPKSHPTRRSIFQTDSRVSKIEKAKNGISRAITTSSSMLHQDSRLEDSDSGESVAPDKPRRSWITEADKQIFTTTLPLSAIFAIMPMASAIDLFWVNRIGSTLAVAGQAAANQVYSSSFWLFSFLPSVTATLVSKSHASGDIEATQDAVCQALFFGILISVFGASFMFCWPDKALISILKGKPPILLQNCLQFIWSALNTSQLPQSVGSPALEIARPYLRIRAFSFAPMLLSLVGFSTFRGTMDVTTSVKVSLISNVVTVLLEPILIHVIKVGVRGAAIATVCGELVSAIVYLKLLSERKLMLLSKVFRLPSWKSLAPLVKGGISLQLRSLCLNFTFLMVARVIQSLDDTGVSASAHALAAQTFQLGGIVLGALGMAAQTLVPKAMHSSGDKSTASSISNAEPLTKRLLMWGSTLGCSIGLVQLLFLPAILRSSPLPDVREAARVPALIAIAFQGINGVVSVGEGIMMGSGSFTRLSINIVLASLGHLAALQVFPEAYGLAGVWISISCFATIRLLGVMFYLFAVQPRSKGKRN
eukprot:scaffold6124_cov122-Cylindrotheca_fusiformis.AAC.34